MFKKIYSRFTIVAVSVLCGTTLFAQSGAYSGFTPYSVFGIGDIAKDGSAYNRSMGGVGIATRNNRFINSMNPASVTAKDSLSFMADFGLTQNNTLYKQSGVKSGNNTFNINNLVFSFPVFKSSAVMFGITPYSNVGYSFAANETDQNIIGKTGNISYSMDGTGSIYQLFGAAGATFWKRLSVGAEVIYYFGSLSKSSGVTYSNTSFRSLSSVYDMKLRGTTAKFGVQYEFPLSTDYLLTVGATYKLGTNMRGYVDDYSIASISSVSDTLRYNTDTLKNNLGQVKFADELGVGVSLKYRDKLMLELDYLRSDFSKCGYANVSGFKSVGNATFSATNSQSFRFGMEYVPNRSDIRYYYRRVAYRFGAYYNQDYYKLDDNSINSTGLTFGVTLPVFRWYNGLTLGVDLGQRGKVGGNLVRERYANFTIGFNIFDIWCQKPRYD